MSSARWRRCSYTGRGRPYNAMPLHDLECGRCGRVLADVYVPVTQGARAYCRTIWCPSCRGALEPIPAIGRMSVFSESEKVTIPVEDPGAPGGFRQETVSTLADIRRLERESEQRERNGEGRRMVWRDYSQGPGNKDVHTLAPDPSLTPPKSYANGTPVRVRRGDPVVADHGALAEDQPFEEALIDGLQ